MYSANAVSQNDKEDMNRIKEIKFNLDSFTIGIDTFTSHNNINSFAEYTLYY